MSKNNATRNGLTNIGKYLHKMQYMHNKVVRDKDFIRNKKRPLMDIIREDYTNDPEFWGDKTFGGKTIKELVGTE